LKQSFDVKMIDMLIEVFGMFAIPKWFVPLTMYDHVVGATSEESVMFE